MNQNEPDVFTCFDCKFTWRMTRGIESISCPNCKKISFEAGSLFKRYYPEEFDRVAKLQEPKKVRKHADHSEAR